MKTSIIDDLSTLTTIGTSVLSKMNEKVVWCISDAVEKSVKNKEDTAEINLGWGILLINFNNNEIRYKFIPGKELEKSLTSTIITESNDLVSEIESSLVEKMTNTYKSFF